MVIEKDGIKCNCGRNGCFEKYASMKAFKEAVQRKFEVENLTGREIRDLLNDAENREKAQDVIDEYIENLSTGLANLINIFEPEVISIGGGFIHFKELLLDKLSQKLHEKNMLFNNQAVPKIITAKLKNDAGIIGSVIEYKD